MLTTTDKGISFFNPTTGLIEVVAYDHAMYDEILAAVKAKDYAKLPDLMNLRTAVEKFSHDSFKVVGETLFVDGEAYGPAVSKKALQMLKAGIDSTPLLLFFRKLKENPSKTSVDQLFLWWTAAGLYLHEDGDIMGFKYVTHDYMSVHKDEAGNALDNNIGQRPTMPRNKVDDNRDVACSAGLHMGSLKYAQENRPADGKIIITKTHPKDVVSVPKDHSDQKIRVCAYLVYGEFGVAGSMLTINDIQTDEHAPEIKDRKWFTIARAGDDLAGPIPNGLRIPVGPWDSREEAQKVLDEVRDIFKKAGWSIDGWDATVDGPFNTRQEARDSHK